MAACLHVFPLTGLAREVNVAKSVRFKERLAILPVHALHRLLMQPLEPLRRGFVVATAVVAVVAIAAPRVTVGAAAAAAAAAACGGHLVIIHEEGESCRTVELDADLDRAAGTAPGADVVLGPREGEAADVGPGLGGLHGAVEGHGVGAGGKEQEAEEDEKGGGGRGEAHR